MALNGSFLAVIWHICTVVWVNMPYFWVRWISQTRINRCPSTKLPDVIQNVITAGEGTGKVSNFNCVDGRLKPHVSDSYKTVSQESKGLPSLPPLNES